MEVGKLKFAVTQTATKRVQRNGLSIWIQFEGNTSKIRDGLVVEFKSK